MCVFLVYHFWKWFDPIKMYSPLSLSLSLSASRLFNLFPFACFSDTLGSSSKFTSNLHSVAWNSAPHRKRRKNIVYHQMGYKCSCFYGSSKSLGKFTKQNRKKTQKHIPFFENSSPFDIKTAFFVQMIKFRLPFISFIFSFRSSSSKHCLVL